MGKTSKITKKALTAIEESVKMLEEARNAYADHTANMFILKAYATVDGFRDLVNRLKKIRGCGKVNIGNDKDWLEKLDVYVSGIVEKTRILDTSGITKNDRDIAFFQLKNETKELRFSLENIKQCIYEVLPPVCPYGFNPNHMNAPVSAYHFGYKERKKFFNIKGMMALYKAEEICEDIAYYAINRPMNLPNYVCLKNALDLSLIFKRAIELGKVEPDYVNIRIKDDLIKRFCDKIINLYWFIQGYFDCAVLALVDKPEEDYSTRNDPPEELYVYSGVYSSLFTSMSYFSKLLEHVELAWNLTYRVDPFKERFISDRLNREKEASEKMVNDFLAKDPEQAASVLERYERDKRLIETMEQSREQVLRYLDWDDANMQNTEENCDDEVFIQ